MTFVRFSEQILGRRPRRSGGLIVLERVDSTHVLARRIVEEYSREGTAAPDTDIVAWRQLDGRGRQGRSWSSPAGGGVYVSLIRSSAAGHVLQTLPLRLAACISIALNQWLGGKCRVKWPNDLVVGTKKLGGMLIDTASRGDGPPVTALSFGVNYGGAHPAELRVASFTDEADAAESPSLGDLTVDLIEAVDAEMGRDVSAADAVERYEALTVHRPGDRLVCEVDEERLEGDFRGFDEHGFLRLGVGGRERLLSTGEILSGG